MSQPSIAGRLFAGLILVSAIAAPVPARKQQELVQAWRPRSEEE